MGRYNFIKGDKKDIEVKEEERPIDVKALFYWNFRRDDYDQKDVEIIIKPIEASTPLPDDLPVGFYPEGDGFKFAGERAWATNLLDRDKRFMFNTDIGGMQVQ